MIITGERQVAPTLDGIRRDHVARYEWAARRLPQASAVLDCACGIGYGAKLLADAGHIVLGIDASEEAVRYGRRFFAHPISRLRTGDACSLPVDLRADAVVSFETIEHLADPGKFLRDLTAVAPLLIASVPNEAVIPFGDGDFAFHFRHYTREQFGELLAETGWRVIEWHGQADVDSDVELEVDGRTLIAVAERAEGARDEDDEAPAPVVEAAPEAPFVLPEGYTGAGPSGEPYDHLADPPQHVALLGLGPSIDQYLDVVKRLGGKHAFADETWGINAVGGVLLCDRIFHMDDVRVQEARSKARPESNIARMMEWLKFHPGPILTSRAHPDYPGLVEFPLQDVLRWSKHAYFNSTAAYAIAYAIHIGVKRLSIFGCDYTYPNAHQAEKGRACVEFWLGLATARGMTIAIAQRSTLMDALHTQQERLYGYDTVDVTLRTDAQGQPAVDFVPMDDAIDAEEVESRYDHSRHPNPLVDK